MSETLKGFFEEQSLSPERYPVASRLVEMRSGEQVGEEVLRRICDPETARVIVLGEPGNGKTTMLGELLGAARSLSDTLGTHSTVDTFFYDSFLARNQRRLKVPYDEWTPEQWQEFNEKMHKHLGGKRRSADSHALQVIELPGVGYTTNRNRGITCMELLAQDSSENNNDTLFLFLVRNRSVQEKAGRIRGAVSDMRDENVISFLARNGVYIHGVDDGSKGGRQIKRLFRKMGQTRHIEAIRREQNSKTINWMDSNHEDAEERLGAITRIPLVRPDDVQDSLVRATDYSSDVYHDYALKLVESHTDETRRNAAYMGHIFEDEMKVPPENYYLLGNPFTRDPVYMDFSQFASGKKKAA